MTTEQRLRALEALVQDQQKEIKQLRQELRDKKGAAPATDEVAKPDEPKAVDKEKKATAALPDWVNKFTPFGDIRIRQEGFYNQGKSSVPGSTRVHARNRTRYRWRLGLKYVYSDELGATIRLASGNPDDPISTNETLEGNFSRKNVNLDWAYLTVTPGKSFNMRPGLLTINAGKFPNPMFRVGELVFDEDLSPEGFNETVALLDKPCGPLDQVKLHAQQWSFEETANEQDGWMFGGQINPTAHVGNVVLEGGVGQYWWLSPDSIATTANTNSTIRGLLTNSLSTVIDDDGDTVITGFAGGFNQTNLTLAATVPDVIGSMPLKAFGDFVYNWEAPDDASHGFQTGVRLGNPKDAGDWAAGLLYEYIERDAVLSTFSWSDFGNGGTNQEGPVLQLDYQLFKPLTLTARGYFTRLIDEPADFHNRTQVRLQLDALLRF
jgi:hypothetical protein